MNKIEDDLIAEINSLQRISLSSSYNNNLQDFLLAKSHSEKYAKIKMAHDLISAAFANKDNIEDVLLYDTKNIILNLSSQNISFVDENIQKLIMSNQFIQVNSKQRPMLTSVIHNKDTFQNYYSYIYPIYNLSSKSKSSEYLGSLVVLCKTKVLTDIIENLNISQNSIFLIIDSQNNMIPANNKASLDVIDIFPPSNKTSINEIESILQKRFSHEKYITTVKAISSIGWKVYSIIPISEIKQDLKPLYIQGLAMVVITIFLLIFITLFLVSNISIPISKIINFIVNIGTQHPTKRLKISNENEIGQICIYINQMLDRLDEMKFNIVNTQKRLYETELIKKKVQLSALQSQINPHFLYNTLDNIRSIALVYNISEIIEISSSMASMFRYAIKEDDYVNVCEEINCISKYMNIMNIRFNNKFNLITEIDQSMVNKKMLKMVLQPIVENAVCHGLELIEDCGEIKIRARMETGLLIFEITDTGKGMNEDELIYVQTLLVKQTDVIENDVNSKRSIGLNNVNSRIRVLHGDNYGISISSQINNGTTVTICMPAID